MTRNLDKYAADYANDYGFEQWQVLFRQRAVLKHCSYFRPAHVLEVGCGTEPLFLHHRPVSSWHVVEPSASFARVASSCAQGLDGVQIVEGFLESSLDILSSVHEVTPFDLIIVGGVLQEVLDPQQFLRGIRNLCTSTTVVHLNVPNAGSLNRRTAVAMGLLPSLAHLSERASLLQQRVVYDLQSLLAEIELAGFDAIDHGGILLKPF